MVLKKVAKRIPTSLVIGSTLIGGFGVVVLIKEYVGGVRYKGVGSSNPERKIFIVTGANTGLGKETAWELARRKAKVYMACRDLERCEAARKEIVVDTKNKYVYCRKCDLASLQSIHEFVKVFKAKEQRLDVLINNAGVMSTPHSKTKDGFEMQLGINHMGHFFLTNLLLNLLKESAPSRIINVTSRAHKTGTINKKDLNSDEKYDEYKAYAQSKLANILFTRELSRRLQGTGVTVNCIHPGVVDTDLFRHMSFYNSWISKIFLKPFTWPFIKDPRQGAQGIIYLALDDAVKDVSGEYFTDYERAEASEAAKDDQTAKWLWAVSEKWTKLNELKPV